jgi:hypothetical protein
MSEKKYPYPKAKGVHIPKTKWLCDAILNGDIQIEYDDEPLTVTKEWVVKWRERLLKRGMPDRDISELSIRQICEELGITVFVA